MINLLTEFFPKMLGHVFPVAIRWYYTQEKLADRVKIRVCEDRDGLEYWNGELPQAQAWIRVTNLTPFPIVIDRLYGSFWYGTQLAHYSVLKQHKVPASGEKDIYIEAPLTSGQAAYIEKTRKAESSLHLGALCRCNVREFQLERTLKTGHARLVNFSHGN